MQKTLQFLSHKYVKGTMLGGMLGALVIGCTMTEPNSDTNTVAQNSSMADQATSSEQRIQLGQAMYESSVQSFARSKDVSIATRKPALTHFPGYPDTHTQHENYDHYPENGVMIVAEQPVSTFSIDVDTASYSNVRRILNRGMLPPKDAVRIEEFVNYFSYQYPQPENEHPFYVDTTLTTSPYNDDRHLMRIALSGKQIEKASRSSSNLVFLLDVSGSMSSDNKLPLLKRALKLMLSQLDERDSVSIVVYAGSSGVVLEPTSGDDKYAISSALDNLKAGGSTNGASGIQLAYQLAQKAFKKEGVNRVILATDGDFNVGVTDQKSLLDMIERYRDSGIYLSVLGFGSGNYNDTLTEQLADKGNGNAAYIDNITEARKVLVEELTGTLQVIAKDVKIQVEFNPAVVQEYRLIGYENRRLEKEDFNNDKVDAGEIGAGHTVTALYELTLKSANKYTIDNSRYQPVALDTDQSTLTEVAYVKLRYKQPASEQSTLFTQIVEQDDVVDFNDADEDYRFASAVAGLAQSLRGSKFVDKKATSKLINIAKNSKGDDQQGYRIEFIKMMETWRLLYASNNPSGVSEIHNGNPNVSVMGK